MEMHVAPILLLTTNIDQVRDPYYSIVNEVYVYIRNHVFYTKKG